MVWLLFILGLTAVVSGYGEDIFHSYPDAFKGDIDNGRSECTPPNLFYGVEWIMQTRREDYGWGEDTHRAILVLVFNDFANHSKNSTEVQLMEYQLEIELAKALFWNDTDPMSLGDLALFIHALLATSRDPRNFYDMDLVEILKARIDARSVNSHANSLAILALCNCRAIEPRHVHAVLSVLANTAVTIKEKGLQAVSLKALACATIEAEFSGYSNHVSNYSSTLASTQKPDGSFGNLYTSALIMQALIASAFKNDWDENKAREFLLAARKSSVNMLSTYYTEMALNAHKIRFLKDLVKPSEPPTEKFPSLPELQRRPRAYFVQYSLRVGEFPDLYHSITIRVPQNSTFFDIMRLCAVEDQKFNFSWTLDNEKNPVVYRISGIPNYAEESIYWQLIYESEVNHTTHTSKLELITRSPALFLPEKDSHVIYWHRNALIKIPNVKYP